MAGALIIGAGVSGLASAVLLSKLGYDVVVVEKQTRPGALVRGFERNNLRYETGFHYAGGLNQGGILKHYLDCLGLTRELKLLSLGPGAEILRFFEDGHDFSVPLEADEIRSIFPACPELQSFLANSRDVFKRSPFLNLNASGQLFNDADWYSQGPTLAQVLQTFPYSERLKSLLAFRCLFYGLLPIEAYFSEFALVNTPYLDGRHTFEGGGEALVKSFEKALERNRIALLTGREVLSLKTDGSRAVAAIVSDGVGIMEIPFELCIYSGNPQALPDLLPQGSLRPVLSKRLKGNKRTWPPFFIFGHTNSSFFEGRQFFGCPSDSIESWLGPDTGFFYISGGFGLGDRWPVTILATLPEKVTEIWKNSHHGFRPFGYKEFKKQRAEALKEHVLKCCPEFGGTLEIDETATDLTLSHYSFSSSGGIYGRMHGTKEYPILPLTRVEHLALAGQDIILPGLLGVLVSSFIAVSSLIGSEKVLEVLRQ